MTTNVTPLRPTVAPSVVPVTALTAQSQGGAAPLHGHIAAETNRSAAVTGADSNMGAR